jgi:hypothetical protein
MSTPTPEADGLRRYGSWAVREDVMCCVAEVTDHLWQCQRKRGHGPEGLYCRQHGKREQVALTGPTMIDPASTTTTTRQLGNAHGVIAQLEALESEIAALRRALGLEWVARAVGCYRYATEGYATRTRAEWLEWITTGNGRSDHRLNDEQVAACIAAAKEE